MRFIYFIFFFFSLLLILPVKSFAVAPAPLPTGVVQVAQAVGTRVTLASLPGVSVIVPTEIGRAHV